MFIIILYCTLLFIHQQYASDSEQNITHFIRLLIISYKKSTLQGILNRPYRVDFFYLLIFHIVLHLIILQKFLPYYNKCHNNSGHRHRLLHTYLIPHIVHTHHIPLFLAQPHMAKTITLTIQINTIFFFIYFNLIFIQHNYILTNCYYFLYKTVFFNLSAICSASSELSCSIEIIPLVTVSSIAHAPIHSSST